MPRHHTLCAVLTTLAVAGTACAAESGSPREGTPGGVGGFRSGECNLVSDQDINQFGGAGRFIKVLANDVGCFWQEDMLFGSIGDGMGISTWWYRGSDVDSERKLETEAGRTLKEVSVNGNEGFEAFDANACSVYVAKDGDVIAWSIQTLNPATFPDLCAIVRPLAQLTQDRIR